MKLHNIMDADVAGLRVIGADRGSMNLLQMGRGGDVQLAKEGWSILEAEMGGTAQASYSSILLYR